MELFVALLVIVFPVCAFDLTPDLACSACSITTHVVEDSILKYLNGTGVGTHDLQDYIVAACNGIPKVAVAGHNEKREFVDFKVAMTRESRGDKHTDLINVVFSNEVTRHLTAFCTAATQVFLPQTILCPSLRDPFWSF